MADIKITIDRTDPKNPLVTVGAAPGTDQGSFEQAKPRIQRVLDALGVKGVRFQQVTEIEQHVHDEQTIVMTNPQVRHG